MGVVDDAVEDRVGEGGTSISTAAKMIASARVSVSRAKLSNRANARGLGRRGAAVASSRRRLVAHSVTTRRPPGNPASLSRRHRAAPEGGAVATTGAPFGVQPVEPGLDGTRPWPERLGAAAAHDVADQLARSAGAADDLLDRNALLVEREHGGFGVATALPAVMLQPFGGRERRRINRAMTKGAANVAHRPLHRRQERRARALEQMPAIGDLDRVHRPGITLARGARAKSTVAASFDANGSASEKSHSRRSVGRLRGQRARL